MLDSKQRAYLRSLAQTTETIFQVGKGGVNENMAKQVSDALEARELIKLHVLETCELTPAETAECLAVSSGAEVVQIIGKRFVLYRESEKHKNIDLAPYTKK